MGNPPMDIIGTKIPESWNKSAENTDNSTKGNVSYPNKRKEYIRVEDIIKIYKQGKIEVAALRGLSCKIYKGELTVIMGPSGCGKTTFLNILGGLDRADSGKIIVNGKNICGYNDRELEKYRKEKIGYVFQFMNLIPELTARENVELPMLLSGKPAVERRSRSDELLRAVGMEHRAIHKPDELSGGEQQRIAIAAALANNPDIILCDEPTGELDSDSKAAVLKTLKDIISAKRDKYIIIVTHDPEVAAVADRLYYIKDGRISHEISGNDLETARNALRKAGLVAASSDISGKNFPSWLVNELRELHYFIGQKIKKIERKFLHFEEK